MGLSLCYGPPLPAQQVSHRWPSGVWPDLRPVGLPCRPSLLAPPPRWVPTQASPMGVGGTGEQGQEAGACPCPSPGSSAGSGRETPRWVKASAQPHQGLRQWLLGEKALSAQGPASPGGGRCGLPSSARAGLGCPPGPGQVSGPSNTHPHEGLGCVYKRAWASSCLIGPSTPRLFKAGHKLRKK